MWIYFVGFKFEKEFGNAINGIVKNIKRAGRGDTNRTKALPENVTAAIHKLLGNLQALMKHRKNRNGPRYMAALNKIPSEYRHKYHILLVEGAQYTVTCFDLRRGQEGIEFLTKGHFKLVKKDGFIFLEKVMIQ